MRTSLQLRLCLLCFAYLTGSSAYGIIVFRGDGRNLQPPADPEIRACWDAHGNWLGATGVAISPHWFISAFHLGAPVGRFFDLGGESYEVVEAAVIPQSDLSLFRVHGTLPHYVPLWDERCGDELKKTALLFGRGCKRGGEIMLPSGQKPGWLWGPSDGKLSWGSNEIAELFSAGAQIGTLLVWSWDRPQGDDEGTLSSGDSGGGVFLRDTAGQWRLAGIHFDVDPAVDGKENQYAFESAGTDPFWASVHDGRGLFRGILGESFRSAGKLDEHPAPMWAGASRIAPHAALIQAIIAEGSQEAEKYPPHIIWGRHKIEALISLLIVGPIGGLFLWQRRLRKIS
jgi:hypothetical protein